MADTLPPTLSPFEAGITVALMIMCLGCFIALKGSLNLRKNDFKLNALLLVVATSAFGLAKPWVATTFGMDTYRFISGAVMVIAVIGLILIIFDFAGFTTGANDEDCLTECNNRHQCISSRGNCAHAAKDSVAKKDTDSQFNKDAGV